MARAFQDELAAIGVHQCWGCGTHNEHGLHVQSYWEGEEGVCIWQSQPYHTAGSTAIINGGILATIVDCHSVCTAIAAAYRAEHREMTEPPLVLYVTGSLQLTYLRPTPIGEPLLLRAMPRPATATERRTSVACTLSAQGNVCVEAEVVVVRLRTPSVA